MLTLAPSKLSTEHSFFHTEVAVNKWEVDWLTVYAFGCMLEHLQKIYLLPLKTFGFRTNFVRLKEVNGCNRALNSCCNVSLTS